MRQKRVISKFTDTAHQLTRTELHHLFTTKYEMWQDSCKIGNRLIIKIIRGD